MGMSPGKQGTASSARCGEFVRQAGSRVEHSLKTGQKVSHLLKHKGPWSRPAGTYAAEAQSLKGFFSPSKAQFHYLFALGGVSSGQLEGLRSGVKNII